MMRAFYCLLILFLVAGRLFGQNFDNYRPLQAANPIPPDFLTLSSEKYRQSLREATAGKKESRKVKQQKKEFYLNNSFLLHELLLSGRILFNDPATKYVNQVADRLLAKHPDLRKQVRFYVVKSKVANAFATDGGIIFVNMGLLAQVENEAQLAFILAHEVSHFAKKHSITGYLESQKIYNGKGDYRRLSVDDKFLARMKHSKELETEADGEGLALYLQSGYSTEKLTDVFEVLKYADLPFEDKECKLAFLESEGYRFPLEYRLGEVTPISAKQEESDEESTHPNTEKRKEAIAEKLNKTSANKDGKLYLVSEESFVNVRKIARFELSYLYLRSMDYVNAIYNSYLLLQENPDSRYLHQIISSSLIQMAKYANAVKVASQDSDKKSRYVKHKTEELNAPVYAYEKVEGASQRLYYLFAKMSHEELTVLAVSYAWKAHQKYPNDPVLKEMSAVALRELAFGGTASLAKFSTTKPALPALPGLQASSDTVATTQDMSKLDKIKKQETKKDYYHYAFVDYLPVPSFTSQFKDFMKEKEKSDKKPRLTSRQRSEIKRQIEKRGVALGVKKVVVVSTEYYKIDGRRRKKKLQFLESEKRNLDFNEKIKEIADKSGVATQWLEPQTLAASDADKFNDYSMLRDWMSKMTVHDNIEMPHLTQEQKKAFVAKYGTPYVCWMGTINLKDNAPVASVLYSILCPYLTPMLAWRAFTLDHETLYFATVFNVEDEKVYLADYRIINAKDADYVLKANIYSTFHQIKQKRK